MRFAVPDEIILEALNPELRVTILCCHHAYIVEDEFEIRVSNLRSFYQRGTQIMKAQDADYTRL